MNQAERIAAALAYVPLIGWALVLMFQRKNPLAVYHLKQSIGLFTFLISVVIAWGIAAWLLALIPYMIVASMSLFTLVIAAYVYGAFAWVGGVSNALRNQMNPLPIFGKLALRLPIQVAKPERGSP